MASLETQQVDAKSTFNHIKVTILERMPVPVRRIRKVPHSLWQKLLQIGREDPRRVVYALKVGTSLTLVALLCFLGPLYHVFSQNAMWAVMTVILVFEFSAGATLYKGLNRGVGTLSAGLLALFIEFFAVKTGHIGKMVIVATAIFVVGSAASFVRFIPYVKKNYDYGVLIFLLTFNLIIIPTFHMDHIFDMACDRLYTIALGLGICLVMSVLFLPNWSGQDLEKATVGKLETLAESVEACVNDYFQEEVIREEEKPSKYSIYKGYRTVLESKSSDETQALFASWEPRHSRHRYPWQHYVKLGTALRHFAYTVAALHGCLESEIQVPLPLRSQFRKPSIRLAEEVSKVLSTLAVSIKDHRLCNPKVLLTTIHEALEDLRSSIKSQPRLFLGPQPEEENLSDEPTDQQQHNVLSSQLSKKTLISAFEFSDALPLAAFVSSLMEMVARLNLVIQEVEVLGKDARFKSYSDKESRKQKRCVKLPGHVVPELVTV